MKELRNTFENILEIQTAIYRKLLDMEEGRTRRTLKHFWWKFEEAFKVEYPRKPRGLCYSWEYEGRWWQFGKKLTIYLFRLAIQFTKPPKIYIRREK